MMRVHCKSCGGTWEVYHKLREFDQARTCPHCDKRIDGETWREYVLTAYNDARRANLALFRDHVNYHAPLFEIDFISDNFFKGAGE